jgi:hypothetical protein
LLQKHRKKQRIMKLLNYGKILNLSRKFFKSFKFLNL